jgi:hypothetical protein
VFEGIGMLSYCVTFHLSCAPSWPIGMPGIIAQMPLELLDSD